MSTEPVPEYAEVTPRPVQLPAILRFFLAAILAFLVNTTLPRVCFDLFDPHVVLADTVYRWLGSAVLLGGFHFFTRVLDQVETDLWGYIGLPLRARAVRQSFVGLAWGGVLITIAIVPLAVTGLDFSLRFSGHIVVRLAITIVLLVGGALLEELMFRGYPFQRLIEAIGVPGAIIVLSIFFGAVHLNNPNSGGVWSWGFFNTLAVGVLFAIAYLRTRALWFPLGVHFGWNFFLGVVYGLPVSGIRDFSIVVRSVAHGPKLLTGGAYGIEGSITGSVVILIGIMAMALVPKRWLGAGDVVSTKSSPSI